ncbi:MAG: DUF559 domain-containing protein [Alphaproteobacteria bacterium]|nr:DUF559 domain-containing protein [Alphaproteobacteria bacterium]
MESRLPSQARPQGRWLGARHTARLAGVRLSRVCSDGEAVTLSPGALLEVCRLLLDGKVFPSRIRGWTLADARKNWQRWHWTTCPPKQIPNRIAAEITLAKILLSEAPRVEVLTGQLTESERAKLIGMNGDLVYWDTTTVLPDVAEHELLTAFRHAGTLVHFVGPCTTPEGLAGLARWAERAITREAERGRGGTASNSERHLEAALAGAQIEVESQRPVGGSWLDFAYEEPGPPIVRLDIEVDGRLYHQGPDGRLRPEDVDRDRRMRLLGWEPLRFWSDQVDQDARACAARVQQRIEELREQ